jgi:glycosyltransferase involved in cell wall biosynthesis
VLQAAGKNAKKGAKLLRPIAEMLGLDYRLEYLDAPIGQEAEAFQRGHVFLHPTYHEGNAYACLEAMATGLPIVTTAAGVFEDIPYCQPKHGWRTEAGYTLPVGSRAEDFALAVRLACQERVCLGAGARHWAERHANMTDFADSWDRLLREIVGER